MGRRYSSRRRKAASWAAPSERFTAPSSPACCARRATSRSIPVLILFDTGGVRLQEANAGEFAIAEIMRAVMEARYVGREGHRADRRPRRMLWRRRIDRRLLLGARVVSEQGRIAVSGPEVIETNRGVEEFDSRDRALVWRTMGGKNRRLHRRRGNVRRRHRAGLFATRRWNFWARLRDFGLDTLKAEQARLEDRLQRFGSVRGCPRHLDGRGRSRREVGSRIARRSVHRSRRHKPGGPAVTLDEILASLFPGGHDVQNDSGVLSRVGARCVPAARRSSSASPIARLLVWTRRIRLSRYVLASLEDGSGPILVVVDSDSQRMSKRDELLGLNEFLAHLAKSLHLYADLHGRPDHGVLYGHSAAGAFSRNGAGDARAGRFARR